MTNRKRQRRQRQLPTPPHTPVRREEEQEEKQGFVASASYFEARMSYSSPIPPPQILEDYNQIIPNAAERILVMAEKQQEHRHRLEESVINGDGARAKMALICETFVVVVGMIAGVVLLLNDKDIQGYLAFIVPMLTAVGTYFYGRKKKQEQVEELRESSRGNDSGNGKDRQLQPARKPSR